MLFQREGKPPIAAPTSKRLAVELGRLKVEGPSSFAHLTRADGVFLQAAGGRGGLLLEKRTEGQHLRAFQAVPVVPFADGTEFRFSAGRIALAADEWFQLRQVVEIFAAFAAGAPEPAYVRWREVPGLLAVTA